MEETLRTLPWLVSERDGALVGYAYGSVHRTRAAYRWSVDVSVYVDRSVHRAGIGRALYAELLETLTRLGYYNAFAGITLPNAASVGLHEAMGFRPVGIYRNVGHKFGRWHDVGWWQLPLREPSPDPAEPEGIGA
jgi:phosphinothricin acetyltransferase